MGVFLFLKGVGFMADGWWSNAVKCDKIRQKQTKRSFSA